MVLTASAARAVLGLPSGARWEQVRGAYRTALLEAHPDKGGDPERFRQVRRAWELLAYRHKNPQTAGPAKPSKFKPTSSKPRPTSVKQSVVPPKRTSNARKSGGAAAGRLRSAFEEDLPLDAAELAPRTAPAQSSFSGLSLKRFCSNASKDASKLGSKVASATSDTDVRRVLSKYQALEGPKRKAYVQQLSKEMKRELTKLVKMQRDEQAAVKRKEERLPATSTTATSKKPPRQRSEAAASKPADATAQSQKVPARELSAQLLQELEAPQNDEAPGLGRGTLRIFLAEVHRDPFGDTAGLASFLRARTVDSRREAIARLPAQARYRLENYMVASAKSSQSNDANAFQ